MARSPTLLEFREGVGIGSETADTDAFRLAAASGQSYTLPSGAFKLAATVRHQADGQLIRGAGTFGSVVTTTMTDGSPAFWWSKPSGDFLLGGGATGFSLDGGGRQVKLIRMDACSGMVLDIDARNATDNLALFTKLWDSEVRGKWRNGGDTTARRPAMILANDATDGCNNVLFQGTHFESNRWGHVRIDSKVGASTRKNAIIRFLGAKFHGIQSIGSLTGQPAAPHVYSDADITQLIGCYFYLCNHYFVDLAGSYGAVQSGHFNSGSLGAVILRAGARYNSVGGNSYNATAAPTQENGVDVNYATDPNGQSVLAMTAGKEIFDNGGRLSMAKNVKRVGGTAYQPDGANASYMVTVSNNAVEGVTLQTAPATGTNGAAISAFTTLIGATATLAQITPLLKLFGQNMYVFNSGGRLALGNNIYLSGSAFIQPDGARSSYVLTLANSLTSDSDGLTVQYVAAAGSGTNVDVTSAVQAATSRKFGVNKDTIHDGQSNPLGRKVTAPKSATAAGRAGDWAVDTSYAYFYTGDGTTHAWRRTAVAAF